MTFLYDPFWVFCHLFKIYSLEQLTNVIRTSKRPILFRYFESLKDFSFMNSFIKRFSQGNGQTSFDEVRLGCWKPFYWYFLMFCSSTMLVDLSHTTVIKMWSVAQNTPNTLLAIPFRPVPNSHFIAINLVKMYFAFCWERHLKTHSYDTKLQNKWRNKRITKFGLQHKWKIGPTM